MTTSYKLKYTGASSASRVLRQCAP